jgi:transcriptional regulator with XRE-family HTH domain
MPEDVRTLRQKKRLSINQLASRSGISIATLIEYEKGKLEISPPDLRRLAKALYVDEWDINPHSTPPPAPPAPPRREEKPARPSRPPRPKEPKEKKEKKAPPKSKPARDSQIAHLLTLAARFDIDQAALEAEIGKPLAELTQKEARHWNGHFMRRTAEEKPSRPIDRRRAYLPEGVDGFELAYLQEQQEAAVPLHFTLFDGQTFQGTVVGFSPYQITIREPGGDEVTLNKLAIAYYRKAGGAR